MRTAMERRPYRCGAADREPPFPFSGLCSRAAQCASRDGDIIPYLNIARQLDFIHQKRHLELHDIIPYLNIARQLDFVHQKRHL